MIMVKLKMRTIYKSFLIFIAILLLIVVAIGILSLFYDKSATNSDIEVNGMLSINYIDGKKINVEDNEVIKFSITNSGDKVNYYNIGFLKVRGTGTYKLKYKNSIIMEGNLKSIDELTTDYISIDIGETKDYSLEIQNNGKSNLTSILNVRMQEGKIISFADSILNNVEPKDEALTKIGIDVAIEDEGLIKSYDDIGVSYYFRGNVLNNYVSFADLTWRIVRINGDGTVRLVLDTVTDSVGAYYAEETESFSIVASPMEEYLKNWYDVNLKNHSNYIANTKFCNDINYEEGYLYNSYTRVMTNKIPTLNCLGDIYSTNIGLLTIDEVLHAGANITDSNNSYYLYNSNITDVWYTMSGAKGDENNINMFMIDGNSYVKTDISGKLYRNVRPVINLIKNIEVKGSGTEVDPYKIVE